MALWPQTTKKPEPTRRALVPDPPWQAKPDPDTTGCQALRVIQRYVSLKRSVRTIIRRMIVTLQTERLQTVEQIRGFLDGNGEVGFASLDRDEAHGFVRRTLVRLNYDALGGAGKGTVREFLGKATGLSRAQVTRLIGQ